MVKFGAEKGQHYIALSLRYGSTISTLVMALGLSVLLARATVLFLAPNAAAGEFWVRSMRGAALVVMQAGILLLLLTPIFRIIVASVSFALERDRKYVLISLGVLLVVLLSIGFSFKA